MHNLRTLKDNIQKSAHIWSYEKNTNTKQADSDIHYLAEILCAPKGPTLIKGIYSSLLYTDSETCTTIYNFSTALILTYMIFKLL